VDCRFLTIRDLLRKPALGDEANHPFSTQEFGQRGAFKPFGVVTNRKELGDQVI